MQTVDCIEIQLRYLRHSRTVQYYRMHCMRAVMTDIETVSDALLAWLHQLVENREKKPREED